MHLPLLHKCMPVDHALGAIVGISNSTGYSVDFSALFNC